MRFDVVLVSISRGVCLLGFGSTGHPRYAFSAPKAETRSFRLRSSLVHTVARTLGQPVKSSISICLTLSKGERYAPFAWPGYAKRSDSTLDFYDPEQRPASLITFRLLIEQVWLGILWVDAKEPLLGVGQAVGSIDFASFYIQTNASTRNQVAINSVFSRLKLGIVPYR